MASLLQGLLRGGARLLRKYHTISPSAQPHELGQELVGSRGQRYTITKLLQERHCGKHFRCVFLATSGNKHYVLKQAGEQSYSNALKVYDDLQAAKYVRLLHDTVAETSTLVYKYYSDYLLFLANKRSLSPSLRKSILRDTLRGIAELHNKNSIHTDIKPDNVMIHFEEGKSPVVKLTDVEDAVKLPPGYSLTDSLRGNFMWRSPEAHCRGEMNRPSDMFSFGATCFYMVLDCILCDATAEEREKGEDYLIGKTLGEQARWFADAKSLRAMADILKPTNPWKEQLLALSDCIDDLRVQHPSTALDSLDPVFRDLITRLMDFHPLKRLTAEEALAHPWFADAHELGHFIVGKDGEGGLLGEDGAVRGSV